MSTGQKTVEQDRTKSQHPKVTGNPVACMSRGVAGSRLQPFELLGFFCNIPTLKNGCLLGRAVHPTGELSVADREGVKEYDSDSHGTQSDVYGWPSKTR
jgi:hypothetical protein